MSSAAIDLQTSFVSNEKRDPFCSAHIAHKHGQRSGSFRGYERYDARACTERYGAYPDGYGELKPDEATTGAHYGVDAKCVP